MTTRAAAGGKPGLEAPPGRLASGERQHRRELRAARMGPVNAHIGLRLRVRRTGMGVSEASVADGLRVSLRTMRAIESGRRALTLDEIVSAARILSVPIAYFYCGLQPSSRAAGGHRLLLH